MKRIYFSVIIVLFFAVSSCKKTKDIQFKNIVSWKVENLNFSTGSVATELLFYNPNTFAVTFKHLEGKVAVEGKDFGYCNSDTTLKIGPQQNFILPVTVNLKSSSILSTGFALLSQDSVRVGFDGFARVGRSGIFINYKFKADTKVATSFR